MASAPDPADFAALLERWLPEYGCAAAAAARARFAQYLALVAAANPRLRLVGSAAPETLVRRHLGESLFFGRLLPPGPHTLVDLGSGAGFPGLALALGWPGLSTTLVESNGQKAAFLRAAVATLGVEAQVRVWAGFLPPSPPHGERAPLAGAQWVTARALERMQRLPHWLPRWLDPDARLAAWVGTDLAARWGAGYPRWQWSQLHRLPGSERRGILLGQCST